MFVHGSLASDCATASPGQVVLDLQERKRDQCSDLDDPHEMGGACQLENGDEHLSMRHSGHGHTFLSKFLCTAIPRKVFMRTMQ